MITTGALIDGDVARHLAFRRRNIRSRCSSAAASLRICAVREAGGLWGLRRNQPELGCPSERVQRGAFGACLMAEPRSSRAACPPFASCGDSRDREAPHRHRSGRGLRLRARLRRHGRRSGLPHVSSSTRAMPAEGPVARKRTAKSRRSSISYVLPPQARISRSSRSSINGGITLAPAGRPSSCSMSTA